MKEKEIKTPPPLQAGDGHQRGAATPTPYGPSSSVPPIRYGGKVQRPPSEPSALRASGTTPAPAWPSRLPLLLHTPPAALAGFARSATLSRCHRALHGPCCFLAALGHVPRQALRGRRCPPLHAVPRPQGPRRHCVPSRSLLGRARRSAAWLVNRRSPHPRRFAARPCPRNRGETCRRLFPASQGHEPRQQAVTVHAHALPRATVIGNDNGGCTRSEDL